MKLFINTALQHLQNLRSVMKDTEIYTKDRNSGKIKTERCV